MHLVSSPETLPQKAQHIQNRFALLCVQITLQHVCRNAVAVNLVLDKASVENALIIS